MLVGPIQHVTVLGLSWALQRLRQCRVKHSGRDWHCRLAVGSGAAPAAYPSFVVLAALGWLVGDMAVGQ
jgi:hypothetical protein